MVCGPECWAERMWRRQISFPSSGFELQTVQLRASRYTVWPIMDKEYVDTRNPLYIYIYIYIYIHGSLHRESNLITVQQDATVFSLLHYCRQLYMFRVLIPIIRSWYSCNYSFWYWLTGSTNIRSRCWVGTGSWTLGHKQCARGPIAELNNCSPSNPVTLSWT